MYTIYTISHPVTSDIVYVGCTHNFKQRKDTHLTAKNKTPISNWVQDLKSNSLNPEIIPIDICEKEDAFTVERYWINQLAVWGFNLLNKQKTISSRSVLYNTDMRHRSAVIIKVRKSRIWTIDDMCIGKVFIIGKNKRGLWTANFKNYARKFGVARFLKYELINQQLIATVTDTKQYENYQAPRPFNPQQATL